MKEFFALPRQLQLREAMSFVSRILTSSIYPIMAMYYAHYFGIFWTGILMMMVQVAGFLLCGFLGIGLVHKAIQLHGKIAG